MLDTHRDEVDCADCAGRGRCWQEPVPAGAGFLVRRHRPLQSGDILFRQGEAFDAPHVVTSGCIILTETQHDGTERIVAVRVPGEIVGLENLHSRTQHYGAQAVGSTTLCRLRWGASGLAGRSAALLRALVNRSSMQFEQAVKPWAGLASVDRVRLFLEDLRARSDQPVPLTRAQIGRCLGLAEETVVRALAELRRRETA
jgi:CRP/FNR family transcriptional regulator